MKKTYANLFAIVACLSVLTFSACNSSCEKGSGTAGTDTRTVSDFKKLEISGAYKIILKQDSSLGVSITTDDNLLKLIKTDVSSDKLKISTDRKSICASGDIIVTIGIRHLDEIKASGAVSVTSDGKVVTKDIGLKLSGATKINMDLDAANVRTDASGVTEINLKGQATSHTIDLSGGGKIHAFDFIVGNYEISTSGASECNINVLRELTVNSSGASSINYKGNPTTINNKKAGVSSIKKVDSAPPSTY